MSREANMRERGTLTPAQEQKNSDRREMPSPSNAKLFITPHSEQGPHWPEDRATLGW